MKNIQLVQKYFLARTHYVPRCCVVSGNPQVNEARSLDSRRKHTKHAFNAAIAVTDIIAGCPEWGMATYVSLKESAFI